MSKNQSTLYRNIQETFNMEVAKENNTLAQHIAVEKTKVLEGEDIKRYTISVV